MRLTNNHFNMIVYTKRWTLPDEPLETPALLNDVMFGRYHFWHGDVTFLPARQQASPG